MTTAELSSADSKVECRGKTQFAIRKGLLERPAFCQRCDKECKPDAHHSDYTLPLLIRWLCKTCHAIEDKTVRTEYPEGFIYKTHEYLLRNNDRQHAERLFLEAWYSKQRGRRVSYSEILHELQHEECLRISKAK